MFTFLRDIILKLVDKFKYLPYLVSNMLTFVQGHTSTWNLKPFILPLLT